MGIDGGYFIVSYNNGLNHKIPKEVLESVAIFGNVSITTPCVKELLRRGISVSYFSTYGAYHGRLQATAYKRITRLKQQIFVSDDDMYCLGIAKQIVKAKINNQIVVLGRYGKNDDFALNQVKNMKIIKNKIDEISSYNELIGYEGIAAKDYFNGLSKIINPAFAFKNRNRMPPRDPFNSMISLGYTLLMHEICGEIENKGLCAYCGFLHKDHERHPTLASDLMEEWRAVIVDSVVLSLIQGNEISREEFYNDEETGGVFLSKKAMKIFITKYENKLRSSNKYIDNTSMSYRRALWHQVNLLTRAIEEKDFNIYKPIYIR